MKSSSLLALLLAFVSIAGGERLFGQVFDFNSDRINVEELHGYWHFHTGDDAKWADPGFDDSKWQLLRSDESWSDQGYKNYAEMAWYRFELTLPATHTPLALYIPELSTSYQVFANGRLIGQFGGLPPHAEDMTGGFAKCRQIFPIPDDLGQRGGAVIIALRVWHWEYRAYNPGGPLAAISVGDANRLREWKTLQLRDAFWSMSAENVLLLGYILAGFAGLGLFALRRSEREYLWFAAFSFFAAAVCGSLIYPAFYLSKWQHYHAVLGSLLVARLGCLLMFVVSLLKERRGWLFWIAIASVSGSGLTYVPGLMGWISMQTWAAFGSLIVIPTIVCGLIMLYRAAKRGNRDARLLFVPCVLWFAADVADKAVLVLYTSGHLSYFLYQTFRELFSWPFPIPLATGAEFLTQLSFLAILVLRFARTRRDEERMAMELESARTVQAVLIPTEVPTVPGFAISALYRPASQVGGDLFQIVPATSGGVLVVIGDVSGKGMPAAMTVSLLVGTIRTLAHYTENPAEILTAMNQRMLARSAGGFTTCLALRVDSNGSMIVANAGHIAPFLDGEELAIESGLPLGLSADSTYLESRFQLKLDEQLTLMTDGVVEARSRTGELYGFERATIMATASAESIAQSAQEFGQEDDITVLTLTRRRIEEPPLLTGGVTATVHA